MKPLFPKLTLSYVKTLNRIIREGSKMVAETPCSMPDRVRAGAITKVDI